jgi:hypothetical protein
VGRLGPPDQDVAVPEGAVPGPRRELAWRLGGGALRVFLDDPAGTAVDIEASSPAGSTLRIGLYGRVVLGRSTLAQVISAFGPPTSDQGGDFSAMWTACASGQVIGIKVSDRPEPNGSAVSADLNQIVRWISVFHSLGPTTDC